ncbi:MAG: cyclic nucleotide-binding domain-containing protein [Bacteriovoracaceae bacterium]
MLDNEIIKLKKGDIIFIEDNPVNSIFIIKKGTVKTFKLNNTKLETTGVFKENELIGELDLFGSDRHSETAVAFESTELIPIQANDIKEYLKLSPEWITKILTTIKQRVVDTKELMLEHKINDTKFENEFFISHEDENAILRKINNRLT